jgi:PAS domain-containing protein
MSASTPSVAVLEHLTLGFAGPETLAVVSRFEDGEIVALSPGFDAFLSVPRSVLIGRNALDIGLWRDPKQRSSVMKLLAHRSWTLLARSTCSR